MTYSEEEGFDRFDCGLTGLEGLACKRLFRAFSKERGCKETGLACGFSASLDLDLDFTTFSHLKLKVEVGPVLLTPNPQAKPPLLNPSYRRIVNGKLGTGVLGGPPVL